MKYQKQIKISNSDYDKISKLAEDKNMSISCYISCLINNEISFDLIENFYKKLDNLPIGFTGTLKEIYGDNYKELSQSQKSKIAQNFKVFYNKFGFICIDKKHDHYGLIYKKVK